MTKKKIDPGKQIGARIKKQREFLGFSIGQLAEASGIPEGTLSEYERRGNQPLALNLIVLSHYLRILPQDLVGPVDLAQIRKDRQAELRKRKKGKPASEVLEGAGIPA